MLLTSALPQLTPASQWLSQILNQPSALTGYYEAVLMRTTSQAVYEALNKNSSSGFPLDLPSDPVYW